MVPMDWPRSSGYRLRIYSPSDQPATASAGVFPFPAPSIRSPSGQRRGFAPADQTWELDPAVAADLRESGYGH